MRLQLIRLVLLQRNIGDLFDEWGGELPSREAWLRQVFSRRIDFIHRKIEFYYVPDPTPGADRLSGRIGRQRISKENEPPDEGLVETERQSWRAGRIVIDPRHHDDGQKAALEISPDVGRPTAVLRSLASKLNTSYPPEPYVMEVAGIADSDTFWKFVEENEHEITAVTFELFAPNMFGVRGNLDREMKELRDNEKAQKVTLKLENQDGLSLKTDRTKETVDYTTEGGGEINAVTRTGKRFSSTNKTKTINISDNESKLRDLASLIWQRLTGS